MKKFDCEDKPHDLMEEPCRCDCGKWFDAQDGYHSHDLSVKHLVCRACHDNEIEELWDVEIDD